MMLRNDVTRVLKVVGLLAIAALICAAVALAAPSSFTDGNRPSSGDPAEFCTPALTDRCPATDGAPGTTDSTTDETTTDETSTDDGLTVGTIYGVRFFVEGIHHVNVIIVL